MKHLERVITRLIIQPSLAVTLTAAGVVAGYLGRRYKYLPED